MIFELSPKFHKLINKLKLCILFNLIFYYLSDKMITFQNSSTNYLPFIQIIYEIFPAFH